MRNPAQQTESNTVNKSVAVRFPISIKITFPYVALAVFFSLAASYVVTILVFENIETRFRSQLLSASRITADLMVTKENDLLSTLRAITFTEGVAEQMSGRDSEALRLLILPLAANNRIEAVEVVDTNGLGILSLHLQPGGSVVEYSSSKGADIYPAWDFASKPLAQFADINNEKLSNKFSGWVEAPWGRYFYVSSPVYTTDQDFVGIVLVGISLETMAESFKREANADAISFYNADGGLVNTTYSLFSGQNVAVESQTAIQLLEQNTDGYTRPLHIGSLEFTEVLSIWQNRNGETLGLLGVARATDVALASGQVSRVLIFTVISLLFMLVIFVGLLVSRQITRPLKKVVAGIDEVSRGNYEIQIPASSNDEVALLANAFNEMASGLKRADLLRNLLNLYVSPEVAHAALEHGTELGGQVVESTILFSDIRRFTDLSEQMDPQNLINLLNRYMTIMVDVIVKNGGMVNKFGGDSLLAVFGTPLNPSPEHAPQAVRTALEMKTALTEFNIQQEKLNSPVIQIGIGIATGLVVAGNIGGEERIEYTVIGDTVNLASRLQSLTKELNQDILVNEKTYLSAKPKADFNAQSLPGITIRGKRDAINVYAIL